MSETDPRVGWIGAGLMGRSMCGHLLAAGCPVTVTTRTRSRAESLLSLGAAWADTPRDVAAASDVVFTMVGYPDDVREVILGDEGVLAGSAAGTIVVDLTSSDPALACEIDASARGQGVRVLDAPVSGGDIGARNATLSIMVGGDTATLEAVRGLLERFGSNIVHQGESGTGQHTKMVNQILIATGMIGVCEALLYAFRAGLDLNKVFESVAGGAAGSWSLTNYGPRMMAGDFEPGFTVDHFVKDMGIALAEASRMKLSLPGLALAHSLYVALQAQGRGRRGTQSLLLALSELSSVTWRQSKPGMHRSSS